MEKVKKMFSPGHQEDDGQMYSQHAAGKTDAGYLKPVRSNESGTSGGVQDSSGNYGAGQGQGISSYISEDKPTSSTTGTGSNTYGSSVPTSTTGTSSAGPEPASNQGVSSLYKDPSSNTQGYSSHDPFASDYSRVTSQDPSATRGPPTSSAYNISSNRDAPSSTNVPATTSSTTNPTSTMYDPPTSSTSRSAMPGAYASTPIAENPPQLGTSGAPQIGRPDFGGNDSLDPSSTTGTSSYGTTAAPGYGTTSAPGYGTSGTNPSSSGLSSGQMAGAGVGAGAAGLTGASLADRSVGGSSNTTGMGSTGMGSGGRYGNTGFDEGKLPDVGQGGGAHPTFTGNRLDPNFQESQPSYHEEALADKTHEGAGWREGTGLTGTSHDGHDHGHDHGHHHHHGTPGTTGTTAGQDPYSLGNSGTTSSRDPYSSTTGTAEPSSHHYGRDAALGTGAAGAGAAGYGLMSKGQGEPVDTTATGPASKTVGPHSSNFANIMDPRVKPEPAKMHEHTTTGPHQSDTFNKMDPKVKNTDPSRQAGMQGASYGGDDSYGRDATQERGAPAPVVPREPTTGTSTRHEPNSSHGHHDPHTKEHHADREAENREQSKGGIFGFLHKKQDPKYQDKAEPDTTARDKYYGTDNATHPMGSTSDDRSHVGPGAGTATVVGAGTGGIAGAGAYEASPQGTLSRDYDGYRQDPLNNSTGPSMTHGTSPGGVDATGTGAYSAYDSGRQEPGTTKSAYDNTQAPTGTVPVVGEHHGQTSSHDYGTGKSSTGTGDHSQDTSRKSYEDGRQSFDEQGRPKEKRSLMDRVLHREHPNKLHKEPPS